VSGVKEFKGGIKMATATQKNIQKDILALDVERFAMLFHAYSGCSPEVQAVINDMAEIVVDESVPTEEKVHAVDALVEALFPALTADIRERDSCMMNSPQAAEALKELDKEEEVFADRLRSLMEAKNITQEELAKATGVGQSAISNMLKRRNRPQQRTIARLAGALSVEPSELWPARNEE
jgi:lambda repressor-like predicted transcriptional regulator